MKRRNQPGLALWIGRHYASGGVAGAESTLVLEHHFDSLTPYLGVGAALDFYSSATDFKLGLLGGARLAVAFHMGWFVEGGLGLLWPVGLPSRHAPGAAGARREPGNPANPSP